MNNNQKTRPAALAALIAGCCLAVGFAAWSITRAMNPPAPATSTTTTATTGTAAPAPLDLAGPAPLTPAQQRRAASGDAALAPHADPFGLLPEPTRAVAAVRPPALPPLATAGRGGSRPPVLPAVSWPGGPGDLPPMRPIPALGGPGPAFGPGRSPRPPDVRVLPAKPDLIGTLLGAQPSAVFRSGGQFTVVPVGGAVGGWRLISVEHGGVVVRSGKETVRILIGGDKPDGIVTAESQPPAVPALSPTAPLAPPTQEQPARPAPKPDPKAAPPQVPPSQPVAGMNPPALDAVTAPEEVAAAVVAMAEATAVPAGTGAVQPTVALAPPPEVAVATAESLPAQAAAALSPPAVAEPGEAPGVTLVAAAAGGVAITEPRLDHPGPAQRPALLLASEPSAVPLTPSPALVSRPRPAKPGVSATGTVVLTGDHPQPPAERAPERHVDPAPLPGRVILDWADEVEPEEPRQPDTPVPG